MKFSKHWKKFEKVAKKVAEKFDFRKSCKNLIFMIFDFSAFRNFWFNFEFHDFEFQHFSRILNFSIFWFNFNFKINPSFMIFDLIRFSRIFNLIRFSQFLILRFSWFSNFSILTIFDLILILTIFDLISVSIEFDFHNFWFSRFFI